MRNLDRFANLLRSPRQRAQVLSLVSAVLIVAGLAARYLFERQDVWAVAMTAAALVAGSDIARRAWLSLRNRAFSIELLVTIATAGALAIGEVWEAAAVTFLFIFGAYLEARTLSQTRKVLGELLDLAPVTALVLRDGRQVEVAPHEVALGETVLVKPGQKLPVDGVVIDGRSAVDESAITGEPIPEEKVIDSAVYAGTVNQNGMLKVRATGVGADTTLARIIRRVEEAQDEKAPTQRFIERFARWYTPAIIVLSAAAFAVTRDIDLALTLLVIGCPGALVISTPVSIVAGIGRAAKQGILIKGGEYLENAGKITAVALDKTGTLTQGKPRLMDVVVETPVAVYAGVADESNGAPRTGGWNDEQRSVLRWAAVAEAASEHPLARPIVTEAERYGTIAGVDEFTAHTGKGVEARAQGRWIAVGTPDLMADLGIAASTGAVSRLDEQKAAGRTAVLVALDGVVIGVLGIADALRENAAEAVRAIRRSGVRSVVMLTGDDRRTALAIAAEAGIDTVKADLLPDDKLAAIRDLQKDGHVVAMAGDGINDAPAMAAANIGIAMGAAGTDVAIETADIALMADDLQKIAQAIGLSKAVARNIRQNVLVALATVTVLLAGVLIGEVHMAGGMLVHQASVLLVIANGMRLLKN